MAACRLPKMTGKPSLSALQPAGEAYDSDHPNVKRI
jgi:hypothetical protein